MKKTIGDLYEKEKFNIAFEAAARSLVASVMSEFEDAERGKKAIAEATDNLKKRIRIIPAAYYRLIEAYINGEDITKYASFVGPAEEYERFIGANDSGLIELMRAISENKWMLKNIAEEKRYYDVKAKQLQSSLKGRATDSTVFDIYYSRKETKKRLIAFDLEKKRIQHIHKKTRDDIKRAHAAFIDQKKDIGRKDSANKLLKSLYSEFKREHKALVKMENLVMSLKRKLIPLEVLIECNLITEKKYILHDKLQQKVNSATRDMECYMNALDELNEVRYKNGIISRELYLRRGGMAVDNATRPQKSEASSNSLPNGSRMNLSLNNKKPQATKTIEPNQKSKTELEQRGLEL